MKESFRPEVGDVWSADLRGCVPWGESYSAPCVGPIRLTWVSKDALVVEGWAEHKTRLHAKTTLPRFLLLDRLEPA